MVHLYGPSDGGPHSHVRGFRVELVGTYAAEVDRFQSIIGSFGHWDYGVDPGSHPELYSVTQDPSVGVPRLPFPMHRAVVFAITRAPPSGCAESFGKSPLKTHAVTSTENNLPIAEAGHACQYPY